MKGKAGFTMVEVIIVVAIIAILASIIMPKMGGSRESAKIAACMSNIRHILIAMDLYANENGKESPWDGTGPTVRHEYQLTYLIPGYLKSAPVCPTGHTYFISVNTPNGEYSSHPNYATLVVSSSGNPNASHPGLTAWSPQGINRSVVKNW